MKRKTLHNGARYEVYKKSHGFCQVCRLGIAGEIHHILPVCMGGKDNKDNLIHLCGGCHALAPNDPLEFKAYKRKGGIFWEAFRLGYRAAKLYPNKSLFGVMLTIIRKLKTTRMQRMRKAVNQLDPIFERSMDGYIK